MIQKGFLHSVFKEMRGLKVEVHKVREGSSPTGPAPSLGPQEPCLTHLMQAHSQCDHRCPQTLTSVPWGQTPSPAPSIPAHLAASAVQAGWVPAAAGQAAAAARWEVADKTGCEVTCTHLGRQQHPCVNNCPVLPPGELQTFYGASLPFSKTRLNTAPGVQGHGQVPRLGSSTKSL